MRKNIITSIIMMMSTTITLAQSDTNVFKGHLENEEYKVFINMDFYKNNIIIPGQEILGEMPGYFGDFKDGRRWMIVEATIDISGKKANITLVNDYGSEDLSAILIDNGDKTFTLQQIEGSTLKIARNRKWVKIPKKIIFKKK